MIVFTRTLCAVLLAAFGGSAWAHSAASLPPSTVVASQGGAHVTLGDVDAFAHSVPADQRARLFDSPQRIEAIVRNLLAQKALVAEARKLKLQDDPTVASDMQTAADAVLVKARMAALQKKVAAHIPDMSELAHERYLGNPSAFGVPKEVDVKHILIGTQTRTDAEAKALADKIYAELKADPSQYDADVTKYSDDSSKAKNHGLITNATSKDYVPEFSEAASKLTKVGQLSAPVKSKYGYHILKLIKRVQGHPRTFAQVKPALVKELRDDYVAKKVQHHLDEIRNHKIDASPAAVASLRTRYADVPAPAGSTSAPIAPSGKQ